MILIATFLLVQLPQTPLRTYVDGRHHREILFGSLPAEAKAVLTASPIDRLPRLGRLFRRDPNDWRAWAVARAVLDEAPTLAEAERILHFIEEGSPAEGGTPISRGTYVADYHGNALTAHFHKAVEIGRFRAPEPRSGLMSLTIPKGIYSTDFDDVHTGYAALEAGAAHDWNLTTYRRLVDELLTRFGPDPVLYAYGSLLNANAYTGQTITPRGRFGAWVSIRSRPDRVRRYALAARRLAPDEPGILLTTSRALRAVRAPEAKAFDRAYEATRDADRFRRGIWRQSPYRP